MVQKMVVSRGFSGTWQVNLSLIEEGVFVKGQLLELITAENLQQDYFMFVCRKVAVLGGLVGVDVAVLGLDLLEL